MRKNEKINMKKEKTVQKSLDEKKNPEKTEEFFKN